MKVQLGNISSNIDRVRPLIRSIDNSKRLVTFTEINGRIEVHKNVGYATELKNKIQNLITFLVPLESFKHSLKDVQNFYTELGGIILESKSQQDYWISNIDKMLTDQETSIQENTNKLKILRDLELEPIKRVEFINRNEHLLIAAVDEKRADSELQKEKEFKAKRLGDMVSAETSILQGEKNFKELQLQRSELNKSFPSRLENILTTYEKLKTDFLKMQDFVGTIDKAGNLLNNIGIIENNTIELVSSIESIQIVYGKAKELYLESLKFYQDITIKGELIANNNEIADIKVKIAIETAKRPYLEAELSKTQKLLVTAEEKVEKLKVYDTVRHLQANVNVLDKNIQNIECSHNAIRLKQNHNSTDVSTGITIDASNNITNHYKTIKYVENVVLDVPNISTSRVNSYNVIYGQKVKEAEHIVNTINFHCKKLEEELRLKEQLEMKLRDLEQKPALIEQRNKSEYYNKEEACNSKSIKYSKLLSDFTIQSYSIKTGNIKALIGIILSHSYILKDSVCGFCCNDKKVFSSTTITLPKFYNSFATLLRNTYNIPNKFCVSNQNRIYGMPHIRLTDVVSTLTDVQFIGSVQDSKGSKQISQNGVRTEDVYDSLFAITKGVVELLILQKKVDINLDKENSTQKIQSYATIVQTIENNNKFVINPTMHQLT